ncbi:MAG: DNA gyrase subunit A [Alphaproteobacteria bacterium]
MSTSPPPGEFGVSTVTIEEEMKRSYLDYAMSVIVSRALPDVRDGLKPVHRRILYSMKESGYDHTKQYHKSARIVGDVMGRYHPHGDQAIYDAMVRMAQPFSLRLPLVDGQGNFGSMDGDPPAAMRYTEVRLARAASAMLDDIDKDTVDFQPNYDESTSEPTVLPARVPNLLVNGAGGIAVGMATNIPPHNLGEVIDACCAYIDNPGVTVDGLMEFVQGPDFPTGGIILGRSGLRQAFHTGRGSVLIRSRTSVEEIRKDREAIIVTEIPYAVNKARMIERIAEVVRDKIVEGISDIRDESDREGVRVVIEIKRDADANVVLNQLYKFTPLQTSFGVNTLALNNGRPEMMTLKDVIVAFVRFREEVVTRRTIFDLGKARDRAHVLVGLALAVADLDNAIAIIRKAKDPEAARRELMARAWPADEVAPLIELIDEPGRTVVDGHYQMSETQARAILDLRLHRLTGLERDKVAEELSAIAEQIKEYLAILGSREKLMQIVRDELTGVREQFADPRRTDIVEAEADTEIEDLIQKEDMVVTVSNAGYIKRVPLATYRAQRRGGKGRAGMTTRDEDVVSQVFVANTHTPLVFFSSRGIAYQLKVFRLPEGTPQARGKAMVNLLPLQPGETISTVMPLPEDESSWENLNIVFATQSGYVRRNALSDFLNIKANGKIAMKLDEGDKLIAVRTCNESQDILLSTYKGMCIRFPVAAVRVFSGRTSMGVRGIRLGKDDGVISMTILRHVDVDTNEREEYLRRASQLRRAMGDESPDDLPGDSTGEESESHISEERFVDLSAREEFILTVTERGFGKRSSAYEYRVTGRGGKGIANIDVTAKNGPVIASFPVEDGDQLVIVTDRGKLIRLPIDDIRIAGRRTQGVTVFRVADDEKVVSVTRVSDLVEESDTDDEEPGDDNA